MIDWVARREAMRNAIKTKNANKSMNPTTDNIKITKGHSLDCSKSTELNKKSRAILPIAV